MEAAGAISTATPAAAAPSSRLPLRVAVGVGIVAASTLALQVLLSRLFAAVLLYHFAFLTISLALLASVLAIAVAITWGFAAATVLALACYAGALAHAALGRWPAA